jgi:uncharacterized cupin superfamily protein
MPLYHLAMIHEAALEKTDAGIVSVGPGWFVLNAREARWNHREGRGKSLNLTGATDDEAETHFRQLGVNLFLLGPGEPIGMYHWEADQEDFLVLAGEALLIIEGDERPLRQWDFVHCPAATDHVVIGAGNGPCLVLAVGARDRSTGPDWGVYTVDETAIRHGAGVERETTDPAEAYARFPRSGLTRYRDDWLPAWEPPGPGAA